MFTNYFIKKKIQALVSDAGGRPHRSLSLDEARSLLVLYNIEDHEDVMRALEPLRKAKKDIKTCVYVPSGGADIPFDDSNIPVHSKSDLNAWGFPSDSVLEKAVYQKAVEAGGFESLNDLIETATDRIAAEVLGLTPEQYAAEVQAAGEKAKKER